MQFVPGVLALCLATTATDTNVERRGDVRGTHTQALKLTIKQTDYMIVINVVTDGLLKSFIVSRLKTD